VVALAGCGPGFELGELELESDAQGLCSGDSVPEGIDVSTATPINWSTVRNSGGKSFAIAKATDGTAFTVGVFPSNWSNMRTAGLTRGAYHIFYGTVDGVAQANYFLSAINAAGGLQAGDIPPVVDVEVPSGNDAQDIYQLHRILDQLEVTTGRVPVIYTSLGIWGQLGNPTGFERYPVWNAAWGFSCAPSIPNLPNLKIWQYLDDQSNVPGVSGLADLNKFNGTAADLAAWVGGGGGVPDLPTMGGSLAGSPALGSNADGRLEVFAQGTSGSLQTAYQTTVNGSWSGWFSLGGGVTGTPAVARNSDGRLQVFVRGSGDQALWTVAQTSANGGWGGWTSLGGSLTSNPVVARNTDGRLEVFVRGSDGRLYRQVQTTAGGGFGGWISFGSLVGGGLDDPQILPAADGRLQIVARGTTNRALYHAKQTVASGGWTDWTYVGGGLQSPPALGRQQDGRMTVFTRGGDGALYQISQTAVNGGWGGWVFLGGVVSDPAVASNSDGRLEVFVRSVENTLYRITQVSPNGGFGAWTQMNGNITGRPVAGLNQDGRLEVFVRGADGALRHKWQTSAGIW